MRRPPWKGCECPLSTLSLCLYGTSNVLYVYATNALCTAPMSYVQHQCPMYGTNALSTAPMSYVRHQCPPDKDRYIQLSLSHTLSTYSLISDLPPRIRIFGNKLETQLLNKEMLADKEHYKFQLSNVTT